jgi:NADPH:quinone reductase
MSRAVVAAGYGGPENLSLVDVEVPEPGPGEVTVEVRASGVNPFDVKVYGGGFGTDPARLPLRIGSEAAGVVTAVGPDAVGPAGPVAVGDEVVVYPVAGAYADRLTVRASSVLPKPAPLGFEQASGLLLTGVTAVHALTATGAGEGDTLLLHAAAGGVGLAVLQLAAARGIRVIGTSAPGKHDLVREFGGEPVSYGEGLADRVRALAPDGVDAAIDAVGTDEAVDVSVELVAARGRIATIAAFGRGAELGLKVLGGGPGADPGTAVRDAARIDLVRLAEAGRLTVLVGQTFPLAQAADAHRAVLDGRVTGKVVLVP